MKKILIVLLCSYIGNVSALEYSNYSPFSDYTDEAITSNELTDVKKERRYKYYKLVKEYGPYEKENTINENYPYIDYDDYKYTDESEYLDEKPEEEKGRKIVTHTLYHHLKADDITYVKLYNSSYQNVNLSYSNLSVIYKDKSLNYNVTYKNANENTINAQGEITLNFTENIDVRYLNILFTIFSSSDNETDLYVTLGNSKRKVGQGIYVIKANARNIDYDAINMDTFSNAFVDYYSDKIEKITPTIHYQAPVTKYTYKDTLYRKYNLVREYSNDYLIESIEDYIYKDEDNYKDYYAYRTRTLLEENKISNIINQNEEIENKFQTDEKKHNNIVTKLLKENKDPVYNNTSNNAKPSMLLNINKDKLSKPSIDKNNITKESLPVYYISYILIIIILLLLVLSKLYKKGIKRARV